MQLNIVDIFSIIASVFSIVLGIIAIWLAVVFYKMSDKTSREIERESNNINASVNKLEILFEKLYSGTFSMMQDTVTDMRKHIYSTNGSYGNENDFKEEIEKKTNMAIQKAVDELKSNNMTEEEIEQLIFNVVSKSKEVVTDVKQANMRKAIIDILKRNKNVTYPKLSKSLKVKKLVEIQEDHKMLFNLLKELFVDGIIEDPFDLDDDGEKIIYHTTIIKLSDKVD